MEAFEIKNFVEYHDLYVQCDTFLLADVFENFRNKFLEIYEIDPPGLAWIIMFKKDKSEIRIISRY